MDNTHKSSSLLEAFDRGILFPLIYSCSVQRACPILFRTQLIDSYFMVQKSTRLLLWSLILKTYELAYGHVVNLDKSEVLYS